VNVAPETIHQVSKPIIIEDPATNGTLGIKQSIEDFLARPYLAATPTLTTSNVANDVLWSNDIWTMLLANPVWSPKLSGFGMISATAVITIQVNASAFNAGGLLVHFIPNFAQNSASHTGRANLISKSQQPGVIMNVAVTKELIFDIPFISPCKKVHLQENQMDWGRVYISVFSPFTSGAASPISAPISVWLSFKDVVLSNPVIANGNVRPGQRGRIKASKIPHPTEQEKGPISKTLSAVSTMAATLASIPTLTAIAGPVSWFTNVAAGVATAFGWSKPLNDNFGSRCINGQHFGASNCNGVDNSLPLGLFADNKLRVMTDLGGTNQDEMSINYIKGIWSYFDFFQLKTTDVPGLLYSRTLSPASFSATRAGNPSLTIYQHTTISFLARLYKYWRGGIEIKFRIFKTGLHTGRFIVAYAPTYANITPTLAQTASLHRVIVDITETNEICFVLPYAALSDYLLNTQNWGKFYVYSLNPLRGPDSVSSTVNVTMEVRGAPDLEFQVPYNEHTQPILAQSGGDEVDDLCIPLGADQSNQIAGASQYAIGEQSTSLLQLLKRYSFFKVPTENFAAAGIMRLNPYHTECIRFNTTNAIIPDMGEDMLTLLSSCYAYMRGGIRIRIVNNQSTSAYSAFLDNNTWTASWIYSVGQAVNTTKNFFLSPYHQTCESGGMSVQIPWHGRTYAKLNKLRGDTSPTTDTPMVSLGVEIIGPAANRPELRFYRAVADDFQLSYFIGVPEMSQLP